MESEIFCTLTETCDLCPFALWIYTLSFKFISVFLPFELFFVLNVVQLIYVYIVLLCALAYKQDFFSLASAYNGNTQ